MHSARLFNFVVLGLSAFSAVEANVRLPVPNGAMIQRRQSGSSSSSPTSSSSTPPPTSSSSSTSSTSSQTSPTRTSSSTSRTSAPSTTSFTPPPTGSSAPPNDSSTSEVIETITRIITTVDSNGVATTLTTQTTSTQTPGLANNGNNQPSGMTPETRNTVIGVVVGVGGAIVLGALAFVAWRIWGRKKQADERDDLMEYPNSVGEKPDTGNSTSNRTPFQSTLESYHAPTQVNTASNF